MPSEDYTPVRLLGRGNYGEAWLVKHARTKKKYVLKKVDLRCADEKERQAAEQEAQLLSQLKHPNIVAYKESFNTAAGFLCIAMVFCEGGDLYRRLQQQNGVPLDEQQVVEWFVQISMAIKYMHDKRILHRDLKTQNIFLTRSEIIKVGDLGIARVLESSNAMATTLIGTPYYMSPELFSNKPYDYKSDIWALGCCVYEMMTLKHAFDAKSFNALAFRILQGKLPPMPVIYPSGLLNLVKAMLKKNPDKRPTIDRILSDPYIKRHIAVFLEKTKTKQPFTNQSRRSVSAKAAAEASSEADFPSHPKLKAKISPASVSKEKVSQGLETLHLGPDLSRIDEESSMSSCQSSMTDTTVRAFVSSVDDNACRDKVSTDAKQSSNDLLNDKKRNITKKTRNMAQRTSSPKSVATEMLSENLSKRDKHRNKKMAEISQVSKESKKSEKTTKLQAEETDKLSVESSGRSASSNGAKTHVNGTKIVSGQDSKIAYEIGAQIDSSKATDVVESVHFVGNNVLYHRKQVQPFQDVNLDDSKIEIDKNFRELGITPHGISNDEKQKINVSRKKSSDSSVSEKSGTVNPLEDDLKDQGSPKPKLRYKHVRNSSGDANTRAFPVILESFSNHINEASNSSVSEKSGTVNPSEDDLKDQGSPKPKLRYKHVRNSSGDANTRAFPVILESFSNHINEASNSSVSEKSGTVNQLEDDLKDQGSPKPKLRYKHVRNSSGDANTRAFPVILESFSNHINEASEKTRPRAEPAEKDFKENDSPKPKSRNGRARKSSGDSNMQIFPIVLEADLSHNREINGKAHQKVEQLENNITASSSPKPESKNRHARKSSGDVNMQAFPVILVSVSSQIDEASGKTNQKAEQIGNDLKENESPRPKENESPRPKSKNRHARKSSGDSNMQAFPVILESVSNRSDEASDRTGQKRDEVDSKTPKSLIPDDVADNDCLTAHSKNVKRRVTVGRPLPPLPKLATEPKEIQFHHRSAASASTEQSVGGSSTPISSSTSSANSSKDETADIPGSLNSSSRQRRRKRKEMECSYVARSIDLIVPSSDNVHEDNDPSEDVVDGFISQKEHRPVSRSFDVFRNPLRYGFLAEDPSQRRESPPRNSRPIDGKETIPVLDDMDSSSSESHEEAETLMPKGPRYKEIKSFISLLCSTLLLKEDKVDGADLSDDDVISSSVTHESLSSSVSDTSLFVKRRLPTTLQHNAKSFTDFRQTMTDSEEKPSFDRNDSYEYHGTSGRLFERISALRLDCINGIGQEKLDAALKLLDNFETEEFDSKLIALLGTEDYVNFAGKIWQLKFCLENAAV